MSEFAANWVLLSASLVIAAPVVFTKIRDTIPLDDDLKFSDETAEEIVGTDKFGSISHPGAGTVGMGGPGGADPEVVTEKRL
jgi:hypothetical protein